MDNSRIYCKDCKYLMFSDCCGECSKGYKGIVNPYDYCKHGKRKEKMNKYIDAEWIVRAIKAIETSFCKKLENGNVIVYDCGKIIRIDIKKEK